MGTRWRRATVAAAMVTMVTASPAGADLVDVRDRAVAPPGAEVVRAEDLGFPSAGGTASFLDAYPALDVTTLAVDTAIIRRERFGPALLVTVVRLSSPDEAEAAVQAMRDPEPPPADAPTPVLDATMRPMEPVVPGVGWRRTTHGNGQWLHDEAYRAVGADVVAWVTVGPEDSRPLLRETVQAHVDRYPVTAPRPWLAPGALAAGALLVVALIAAGWRARRRRGRTSPPPRTPGTAGPAARVNW